MEGLGKRWRWESIGKENATRLLSGSTAAAEVFSPYVVGIIASTFGVKDAASLLDWGRMIVGGESINRSMMASIGPFSGLSVNPDGRPA